MQLTIDDLIANKHIQRELEALLYISRKPASRLTAEIDIEIIFLSTTTTARKAEKIHIKDQFNFAGCYSVKNSESRPHRNGTTNQLPAPSGGRRSGWKSRSND